MTFWKLWTLHIAIIASLIAAYHFGYVGYVLENDVTRISVLILGLFLSASAWVGVLAVNGRKPTKMLEYIVDACMGLGMIGTLIGMSMVLGSAFRSVDVSDINAMTNIMGIIASGIGTALLTTLVGLGASLLLKFELVILEG